MGPVWQRKRSPAPPPPGHRVPHISTRVTKHTWGLSHGICGHVRLWETAADEGRDGPVSTRVSGSSFGGKLPHYCVVRSGCTATPTRQRWSKTVKLREASVRVVAMKREAGGIKREGVLRVHAAREKTEQAGTSRAETMALAS